MVQPGCESLEQRRGIDEERLLRHLVSERFDQWPEAEPRSDPQKKVEQGAMTQDQAYALIREYVLEQCKTGLTYEEYKNKNKKQN